MAVLSRIHVNENRVERQAPGMKSLLFICDYPDYEMCCFKRMSEAFYLNTITVKGIEDSNTKNSIK